MKTKRKSAARFLFICAHLLVLPALAATPRITKDFDADWRFSKGDFPSAMMPAFDDRQWRTVNVPHDWSIEGPFGPQYGSGNGFAPGGIGWYRKHFPLGAEGTNRLVTIEFDGVYEYSEVWINGQFAGARPFGFASFAFDLTPYVKWNSADNVLAVRVDHSRFADSRFYTGSGIYRNVRLVVTDPLRIAHWGTVVTTSKIKSDAARIRIETTVENNLPDQREFSLQSEVTGPDGKIAGTATTTRRAGGGATQVVVQEIKMAQPQLWSPASPALYTVKSTVKSAGKITDEITTPFGIRSAVFDPDHGFLLNGVPTKLKGVCLHHDAGSLGAAVLEPVLKRRLLLLKEMGVNAIRTSHNPPDPVLLDLCDRLGFLVMDEAFDEFTPGKNKWVTGRNDGVPSHFGYGELFAQWSVTDISDMVRRDRNHPSIILWSIGNEIDYANDPFSDPVLGDRYRPRNPPATELVKCAAPLVDAVKELDHTRPVTAALATVNMSDAVGLPGLLDAVGYNYQETRYAEDHRQFPRRIIYGSENSHSASAWSAVRTNDYIAGQFLWTGVDYLGEADAWPNRASGPGLLDLCGFKKPLGWFRQSLWSDQPMVYLCVADAEARGPGGAETWNWPSNATVRVSCYANCPEVTLTLNGHSLGTKQRSEAVGGVLTWRIPYAPGTLRAVGRTNGQEACSFALQTAGPAARIELRPDTVQLRPDGRDIAQIEFRIVDEIGMRVPDAGNEVRFVLSGPARILGIGNGDLDNSEKCAGTDHRAYQGRGLVILQNDGHGGDITLQAIATGLAPANVYLHSP